jgi:hypothetical protein
MDFVEVRRRDVELFQDCGVACVDLALDRSTQLIQLAVPDPI